MSTREQLENLVNDPRRVLGVVGQFVVRRVDSIANGDPLDVASALRGQVSTRPAFAVLSNGVEMLVGPAAAVLASLQAERHFQSRKGSAAPVIGLKLEQRDAPALAEALQAAAEGRAQ